MYRAIIVEDKLKQALSLKLELNEFCPQIEVVDICTNNDDALNSINNKLPQILFLDIEIGDASIFDLLKQLNLTTMALIFITGAEDYQNKNYALNALKLSAVDFLLKPAKQQDLVSAVEAAILKLQNIEKLKMLNNTLSANLNQQTNIQDKILVVYDGDQHHFIPLKQLVYISTISKEQTKKKYSTIEFLLDNGSFFSQIGSSLIHYEHILENCNFHRISQQKIINLNFVSAYKKNFHVKIKAGISRLNHPVDELEITKSYKDKFHVAFLTFTKERLINKIQ